MTHAAVQPTFQTGDIVGYIETVVEGQYAWSPMPVAPTPIAVGTFGVVQCFVRHPDGGDGYLVQLMLAPNGVDAIDRFLPVHYYK